MHSYLLFHGLRMLFVGVLVVGAVLFVLWANKLKPAQLQQWVVKLLVIGGVGLLVTALVAGQSGYGDKGKWKGKHGDRGAKMMEEEHGSTGVGVGIEVLEAEGIGLGIEVVREEE